MRRVLSDDELRVLRMRAQLLAGEPARDVGSAVARVGAIQAQAAAPARLALRARTSGLTAEDVDRACGVTPAVIRTWLMRGTLHMVAAADAGWMAGLFGPVFSRAGRRRREQLGLDDRTCERGLVAIEKVLRGADPLTRTQLVERIADEGVHIDPSTQAPAHLIAYAALQGLICRGPEAERDESTYVLMDDWVGGARRLDRDGAPDRGSAPDRDTALAELARRYLAGHGPATIRDFLAWSGLPAADGKKAFALISEETVAADAAGATVVALASTDLEAVSALQPRLLGHFDALLLGYRRRDLVLDPVHAKRIQSGGGFILPAVLVGGRVVGTWRLHRAGKRSTVRIEPFDGLPRDSVDGLCAESEDIGRFLGAEVGFEVAA
jgi:hypothetical protein